MTLEEQSPSTASFVEPEKCIVVSRAQEFTLRSGRVPAPRSRNVKRVDLLHSLNCEVQRLIGEESNKKLFDDVFDIFGRRNILKVYYVFSRIFYDGPKNIFLNIYIFLPIFCLEKWLVVHGMCGCGKTQLIVDLLWERPELALAHFQRIVWSVFNYLCKNYLC